MTIKSIKNVAVFHDGALSKPKDIIFEASPGNIISANYTRGRWFGAPSDLEEETPENVIDGSGCTLLPGLIDVDVDPAAASMALDQFASYGIATVIDMSSSTAENRAMRDASEASPGLPTYLACGTVAISSASDQQTAHLKLFTIRSTEVIRTVEEAEAFVDAQINGPDKVDCIKAVIVQPGFGEEVLTAITNATHRNGKMAVAHIAQAVSYEIALRTGFDILSHVSVDAPIKTEIASQLAERGVICVPMLCRMQRIVSALREAKENDTMDRPDFEHALATVIKLHDAGVSICLGTGATESGEITVPFGDSLHEEMELLQKAGLSNKEILQAATSVASRAFRLHDRGLVGAGLRADLMLVEGNPMEDITATRRIRRVWIKGIEVDNVSKGRLRSSIPV